jgi:hypothetical protein
MPSLILLKGKIIIGTISLRKKRKTGRDLFDTLKRIHNRLHEFSIRSITILNCFSVVCLDCQQSKSKAKI